MQIMDDLYLRARPFKRGDIRARAKVSTATMAAFFKPKANPQARTIAAIDAAITELEREASQPDETTFSKSSESTWEK
jgi:hypothetical protein